MNETARSALRAVVGVLATMVGLWLIADKSSALQVALAGGFIVAVGGAIAGPKWAGITAPLAFWTMLLTYEATDCAGCAEGGEEVVAPAIVFIAYTAALSLIGVLGGFAGVLLQRRTPAPPARAWPAAAALLLVAFVGLVAIRASTVSGESGPVITQLAGKQFRAGDPTDAAAAPRSMADFGGSPAAWFGDEAFGYRLTNVVLEKRAPPNGQWNGDSLVLIYGACSPAPCPAPLSLNVTTWCRVPPEFAGDSVIGQRETLAGGVILERRPGGDLVLWTGNVSVTIHRTGVPEGREAELVAALHTLDGGPLPPPSPPSC